jgi:hypothetical protein
LGDEAEDALPRRGRTSQGDAGGGTLAIHCGRAGSDGASTSTALAAKNKKYAATAAPPSMPAITSTIAIRREWPSLIGSPRSASAANSGRTGGGTGFSATGTAACLAFTTVASVGGAAVGLFSAGISIRASGVGAAGVFAAGISIPRGATGAAGVSIPSRATASWMRAGSMMVTRARCPRCRARSQIRLMTLGVPRDALKTASIAPSENCT